MALFTPQEATLGDIEGEGYAFIRKTFRGKETQGVFFGTEEDTDALEALQDRDTVEFSGVVYYKKRSGGISERSKSLVVDVKNLVSVRAGERVDFKALAEA